MGVLWWRDLEKKNGEENQLPLCITDDLALNDKPPLQLGDGYSARFGALRRSRACQSPDRCEQRRRCLSAQKLPVPAPAVPAVPAELPREVPVPATLSGGGSHIVRVEVDVVPE
jgi:hypothetical protein